LEARLGCIGTVSTGLWFAIASTTATAFTARHALLIRLLIFVFITYYLFAAQEKVDVIARVRTTFAKVGIVVASTPTSWLPTYMHS
jgi:hypothetical protein